MKVILSRKGFDSENGGMPSPIMPDGTLLSLPIISDGDTQRYSKLKYKGKPYLEIIKELKPKKEVKDYSHLDPDIRKNVIERDKRWLPLFGQTDKAQSHLSKAKVKEGDLFLFFGWFKQTEWNGKHLRYKKDAPSQHIIWGYLQIGKIFDTIKYSPSNLPKWMQYHPHAQKRFKKEKNNCIYVASENLSFAPSLPGGGVFKLHKDLVLTKKGALKRSQWELPSFFKNEKIKITYHTQASYKKDHFQSVARGQEFVIETNSKVTEWAKKLLLGK